MLLAACSSLGASLPRTRSWAEGPARWLLLPAEQRELQELRSDAEGSLFIEEFWRRRDPRPELAGNPVREAFETRVDAADRVYGEDGRRGSLTDRGRALVLLGPPSVLRQGTRTAPAWRPGRRNPGARTAGPMAVRTLVVETWEYGAADLWPSLIAMLAQRDEAGIRLEFLLGTEETRLIDGEKYLQMAAEATLQLVPPASTAPREATAAPR